VPYYIYCTRGHCNGDFSELVPGRGGLVGRPGWARGWGKEICVCVKEVKERKPVFLLRGWGKETCVCDIHTQSKLVYVWQVSHRSGTWGRKQEQVGVHKTHAIDRHMVYIYDMTYAIDTWLSVEARIYKLCYTYIYIPMGIISMYKKRKRYIHSHGHYIHVQKKKRGGETYILRRTGMRLRPPMGIISMYAFRTYRAHILKSQCTGMWTKKKTLCRVLFWTMCAFRTCETQIQKN